MRHWTFWEWIAYACLFVGAVVLAADTGIKLSPDLAHVLPFIHGPWWGFSPLAFVIASTLMLLAREFEWVGVRQTSNPTRENPHATIDDAKQVVRQPKIAKWMTPYEAIDIFAQDELKQTYMSALNERNGLEKEIAEVNKEIPESTAVDVLREMHGQLPDDGSPRSRRKKLTEQLNAAKDRVFFAHFNLKEYLKDELKMGSLVSRGVLIDGNQSSDDWIHIKSAHWTLLDFESSDPKLETASGGGRRYRGIQIGKPN